MRQESKDAPTFFTRPKATNCLRAAAPPILIGRSRRRGEKRGERIDGIEPLCGPPRRSRSTSKRSRSIESPNERFVAIESRRGESPIALPSHTVVARSRRGGKSKVLSPTAAAAAHLSTPNFPPQECVMTFQIYVGGQRVNSDFITSTPAWASQQVSLPAVKSRQSGFHRWKGVHRMTSKTRVLTRPASLSQPRSRTSPASDAATIPTRPR